MISGKIISGSSLIVVLALSSCTGNFDDMNTDPNNARTTRDIFYMTKAIVSTAYDYQKSAYMDEPASAGRYITMVRNEGNDTWGWDAGSWDADYLRLTTVKELRDIAETEKADQYVAVADILEVFNFAYITDRWGDIPYLEALQLSGDKEIVHPQYDKQEDIYPDLLKKLEEANNRLDTATGDIDENNDALYQGSKEGWQKLANSLRLRLLLRCAKKYTDAIPQIQEIVSHPEKYPIFTGNGDNAEVPYVGTFKWPGGPTGGGGNLTDPFAEFIKRKPSKEFVDFLQQRNDPRLPMLVDKTTGDPAQATVDHHPYVGVPNAINSPYDYNGGDEHISTLALDLFYKDQDAAVRASLMTYPEVCFILAEAAQQNGVNVPGETAESLYYKGIKAAMDYWGVSREADDAHYYDQPAVKYDGTLKQLIGQKWAALFLKGPEGWFDYRRTGDILDFNSRIGPAASQHNIPYRFIYPDNERNLNREAYDKAIAVFGEDTRNTKMWYLK
ncbi:SusD/RagB family nutrient-binding outer membrane lipoprotein [Compostibacter hankyongensis]|uniref:SusD/RagB family nutrient-binding outer membrane lipoprotein n=1 Tax=Compostibacter hankyongensis TaxID=1007089 RepID=A0ABP8FN65_9BACT